jgi:hypothetical protein
MEAGRRRVATSGQGEIGIHRVTPSADGRKRSSETRHRGPTRQLKATLLEVLRTAAAVRRTARQSVPATDGRTGARVATVSYLARLTDATQGEPCARLVYAVAKRMGRRHRICPGTVAMGAIARSRIAAVCLRRDFVAAARPEGPHAERPRHPRPHNSLHGRARPRPSRFGCDHCPPGSCPSQQDDVTCVLTRRQPAWRSSSR